MMKTKSVLLSDIFIFPPIKGVTEEFIVKNPGSVPVYGGRISETPVGFIADNLSEVKYFSNCLAWNREGSVGYVFYHKGKFTTNDHHRPMILKPEYNDVVDLEYVRIVLQQFLLSQGFTWSKTASKEKVKQMSIEFPIDDNENIDIKKQRKFVEKFVRIDSIQKNLNVYQKKLEQSLVVIDKSNEYTTVFLGDEHFLLTIGKRVLKKNITTTGIPVYSANPNKIFGRIEKSNLQSFDSDSIIWGIDGNFEWGFIEKGKEFATTDHCGRLIVIHPKLLSEYVYYQLRETSSSYGFNRTFRASLENIKAVSINVPVDSKGDFDIESQKKMINKYKEIDLVKTKLLKFIEYATSPQIDVQEEF